MKNYFVINPAAGQGTLVDKLAAEIDAAAKKANIECQVFFTDAPGDGEKKSRMLAENLNGEEGRFFACGGDGTVGEVLNGIVGFDNVALGVVPIGTGNDTIRNFGTAEEFMNIDAQLRGITQDVDLMKYSGIIDGEEKSRYCINMFNIGFDCNVAELTSRLKKKPLIEGSMAYLMGVLGILVRKKGASLTIYNGDEKIKEGEVLLCTICNGSYCGGGIKSTPQAEVNDGLFDIVIVKVISRTRFLRLFPRYKDGTYYGDDAYKEFFETHKSTYARIVPYGNEEMFICVDGEIQTCTGMDIEMCHSAIKFIVPQV